MARKISVQEVSRHCIAEDLWIVVDGTVYDLTEFAPEHPGGAASKSLPYTPVAKQKNIDAYHITLSLCSALQGLSNTAELPAEA